MNKKVKYVIFLCLVIFLLSSVYLNRERFHSNKSDSLNKVEKKHISNTETNTKSNTEPSNVAPKEIEEKSSNDKVNENKKDLTNDEITIACVGDIIVHDSQLAAQYNSTEDSYDFTNNFKYVKRYISEADIALANLETTLAGKEKNFSGYPLFNTPDEILDALKDSGFDILNTANNHMLDRDSYGFFRTLQTLKDKNFKNIGTRSTEKEKSFIIENIKGVNIGFIGYTYETPRIDNVRAVNAIKIPNEVNNLANTFSYEFLDEDLKQIEKDINTVKENGAEVIVFFIHWGNEYHRTPNKYQKKMAQKLSDYGVDIIFGCHPHVLQPIEFINSEVSGKKTLVVYSMGNFISNQQYERTENRYTEDGMIVKVKLKKDGSSDKVNIEEASYIPTWVHRYNENKKFDNRNEFVYEILPLFDALEDKEKYGLIEENDSNRADKSLKNTVNLIQAEKEIVEEPTLKSKIVPAFEQN